MTLIHRHAAFLYSIKSTSLSAHTLSSFFCRDATRLAPSRQNRFAVIAG